MKNLILKALEKPTRRLQTSPSKAVKIRRAVAKVKRSQVKALRVRVQPQ